MGEEFWSTVHAQRHFIIRVSPPSFPCTDREVRVCVVSDKKGYNTKPLSHRKTVSCSLSIYLSIYVSMRFAPRCSGGHRAAVEWRLEMSELFAKGRAEERGEGRGISVCFFFNSSDITEPLSPNPPPNPFSLPLSFFLFCDHGSNRKPALCLPE